MFDLLESTELRDLFDHLAVSDQDDWSFEDLFYEKCRHQALASSVFDYCCLLADKGEIEVAIKRLRFFFNEMDTASGSTRCDVSNHLHLLVVLLHTKDDIESRGAAVTLCNKAIQIKSSQCSSLYTSNIQLTLAYLYQRQDQLVESMALVDQIVQLVISKAEVSVNPGPLKLFKSSMDFPFQQELLKVSLLLECCVLYRTSNHLEKAQHCLEEAWLILYSSNNITDNLCSVSSTKGKTDSKSPTEHVSEPVNQPYTAEAQWVSKCRGIPTMPGIYMNIACCCN